MTKPTGKRKRSKGRKSPAHKYDFKTRNYEASTNAGYWKCI